MEHTRQIAYSYASKGLCVVVQKREVIRGTSCVRGPIRIRATLHGASK